MSSKSETKIFADLGKLGFNLSGTVSVDHYDEKLAADAKLAKRFPWARSILVVGTGGRSFWNSLTPGEAAHRNPIDRATVRRLKGFQECQDRRNIWLFPFRSSGNNVRFRHLGELAGFGVLKTVLGILIHPRYGPWVSLRAAMLTEAELVPSRPLENFEPCAPCSKPCISACPAFAVRNTGVDFLVCGKHISRSDSCEKGCLSRKACVYGQEESYGPLENEHRQSFANRSLKNWVRKKV